MPQQWTLLETINDFIEDDSEDDAKTDEKEDDDEKDNNEDHTPSKPASGTHFGHRINRMWLSQPCACELAGRRECLYVIVKRKLFHRSLQRSPQASQASGRCSGMDEVI